MRVAPIAAGLAALAICACGGKTDETAGGPPRQPDVTIKVPHYRPDKLDLVVVIDNSSSMADKQAILALAVPDLVDRLVSPICVDPKNNYAYVAPAPAPGMACPPGSELDFSPLSSVHVGVLTSSLGGHGTTACSDAHNDDKGRLITRGDTSGATGTVGFLDYAAGKPSPNDAATVKTAFANIVTNVGQQGCGYPAPLEAAYRFLVDPDPPSAVRLVTDANYNQVLQADYPDETILQERKDFLRPDSLVVVVIVTDQNDCSLMDEGQAYLALLPPVNGRTALMHGTSACKTDPNDPCCFNCGVQTPPAGCSATKDDPECALGNLTAAEDPERLRCFHMKERYGIDFRYPVTRYIDGFSSTRVKNRKKVEVQNPLFEDLGCPYAESGAGHCLPMPERDPSFIFVVGIVGVPWQDIARDPSDLSKGFQSSAEMIANDTWSIIIGDPDASPLVPPADPLMIESVAPRTYATATRSPLGPAALPQPPSGTNPVNGHERDANSDLQYACIFQLPMPRDCTLPANAKDCDCLDAGATMSPLCQSTTQIAAKAYPGIRELQVLRGLGAQGIAASICPANLQTPTARDYGYRPAIYPVMDWLRSQEPKVCVPDQVRPDAAGQVPCVVFEASHDYDACDCYPPGRRLPDPRTVPAELTDWYSCVCAIDQLTDQSALADCRTSSVYTSASGFHYVDAAGDACPTIRFVGGGSLGLPRDRSLVLIACDTTS